MSASPAPPAPIRSAVLLGIALGGFFDGILLHQILQWHHLLSLVPGVDLRAQVLWDGVFHAAMYVLAAWGLWGLWRWGMPDGRRLLGALLLGVGLWHLADAVLSHLVLGLHRVRVDAANPLAWDLGWFAAFGFLPLGLGWALLRGGSGGRGSRGALVALALVAVGAGGWALRPPPDMPLTTAVFRPGMAPSEVERGIAALGGRVVWGTPELGVALIDMAPERRWGLYQAGAVMVAGAGAPVGCLAWSEAGRRAA